MNYLLQNKKYIITGISNKKSLAFGCYKEIKKYGGEVIITYKNERMHQKLKKMFPNEYLIKCDVNQSREIEMAFAEIKSKIGKLDGLIHSIAYANKESFKNDLSAINVEDFNKSLDISVYSFISMINNLKPIIKSNGSVITMTFIGSTKVIDKYNMMGIAKAALESSVRYLAYENDYFRINSISSGPQKTLSTRQIINNSKIKELSKSNSVFTRKLTNIDVGNTAVYLLSDLANAVTGENINVDNGFHLS